ncbi:hypothetical protein [Brevibacterium litoralis]|uniref:hypothetical protein n=1 Tax=Brevibacterium litoralis TaxID=3138935 RepID=UPI0032EF86AC
MNTHQDRSTRPSTLGAAEAAALLDTAAVVGAFLVLVLAFVGMLVEFTRQAGGA